MSTEYSFNSITGQEVFFHALNLHIPERFVRIEYHPHGFSSLRTDKARKGYSALTFHRAPHEPLLRLSDMDLIAQRSIAENFIEPSFEWVDTFNQWYDSSKMDGIVGH